MNCLPNRPQRAARAVEREVWVDNVKVVACILVVTGHFFQSMVKSDIIPESDLYQWFNQTIYYFHVPLFFICSGYLYQKLYSINNVMKWGRNVLNKLIILGIPYFVFSLSTLLLKKIFSASINTTEDGFYNILFLKPTAPYWYLYILFFIFLVTPTVNTNKKMIFVLVCSLLLKIVNIATGGYLKLPYAINGILNNEIWFVLGMSLSTFRWKNRFSAKTSLSGIICIIFSIFIYIYKFSFPGLGFFMGLIACMAVISAIYRIFQNNSQNKLFGLLANYNLPIFVMHTIFAAGTRSVLLKLGLTNAAIHIILGLLISFSGPVIAARIMNRIKYVEFLLYPGKYIRV